MLLAPIKIGERTQNKDYRKKISANDEKPHQRKRRQKLTQLFFLLLAPIKIGERTQNERLQTRCQQMMNLVEHQEHQDEVGRCNGGIKNL